MELRKKVKASKRIREMTADPENDPLAEVSQWLSDREQSSLTRGEHTHSGSMGETAHTDEIEDVSGCDVATDGHPSAVGA